MTPEEYRLMFGSDGPVSPEEYAVMFGGQTEEPGLIEQLKRSTTAAREKPFSLSELAPFGAISRPMEAVAPILDIVNRPMYGIIGGVKAAQQGKDLRDILGGAGEGLGGKVQSWGDVFGIPDEGLVGKGGRLALDLILNPLNAIPAGGIAKAATKLPKYEQIVTALAGNKTLAQLMERAPESIPKYKALNEAFDAMRRRVGEGDIEIGKAAPITQEAIAKEMAQSPALPIEEIISRWERGKPGTLSPEVTEGIKATSDLSTKARIEERATQENFARETLDRYKAQWQEMVNAESDPQMRAVRQHVLDADVARMEQQVALQPVGMIEDEFMPNIFNRIFKEGYLKDVEKTAGTKTGAPGLVDADPSRVLRLLVDIDALEAGRLEPLLTHEGKPIIVPKTALAHPEKGGYATWQGIPVGDVEASRLDIARGTSGIPIEATVNDMGLVYGSKAGRANRATEFLKFNQEFLVTPMEAQEGKGMITFKSPEAPAHWQTPNIKGFEGYVADPVYARLVERATRSGFDPDTMAGSIGMPLEAWSKSLGGRALRQVTKLFVNLNLPLWPGFHIANKVTNEAMLYQAGVPLVKIPWYEKLGAQILRQKNDSPVFSYMDNKAFLEAATAREVVQGGFAGSFVETDIGKAIQGTPFRDYLREKGITGRAAAKVADYMVKAPELGFKAGGWLENESRIAAMIHYLKKIGDDKVGAMSPADQAKVFDEAARFAKNALIPYNELTPWMQQIRGNIYPFLAWNVGMPKAFARALLNKPGRIGRFDTTLNYMFEPASPEDREVMDPNLREASPVFSAAGYEGWPFGRDEKGNRKMLLLSRFLPQGQMEGYGRPQDVAMSWLNPYLRAPIELTANREWFRDRPIEQVPGIPATTKLFGQNLGAKTDYLLRSLPTNRYMQEADRWGRYAGLWEDPARTAMDTGSMGGALLTGTRTYPFDPERYRPRREIEIRKEQEILKSGYKRAWVNYSKSPTSGGAAEIAKYEEMLHDLNRRKLRLQGMVEGS
jgi:hypothetical protein